ncbi:hypothetical protein Sjap_005011 [Stephania japonica]|uniref:Terpene synthase N-terminal domain-containing protein n=1 Tax=Stephania japonica TaxID=461633 RepID=A0AAP0K396_9MAGN
MALQSLLASQPAHCFKAERRDETGHLKEYLREDVEGVLSMYDASHFALEGEDVLDVAKTCTAKHLMDITENICHI